MFFSKGVAQDYYEENRAIYNFEIVETAPCDLVLMLPHPSSCC